MNAKRTNKKRNKNVKRTLNEYKPTKEELEKVKDYIKKIEVIANEKENKSQL